MTRRGRIVLKTGVWAAALAPLCLLGWRLLFDPMVANPIDEATDTLGDWTLRLLLASLAVTPLRVVSGWSWPATLRRLLGLFAFAYAVLHLSVWLAVDHYFDWAEMGADVLKRPYVTIGALAVLCLLPLAATSTAGMVKRMGARAWRRLHRLAYGAAILGVLHYVWLAKVGVRGPYYYAAVLTVLLGVRVAGWARRAPRRPPAPAGAPRPGSAPGHRVADPAPGDWRLRPGGSPR